MDAERAALAGLIAALKPAPAGRAVELQTSSEVLLAAPGRIAAAQAGQDPPIDNLDLWAQAQVALASRPVRMLRAQPASGAPPAFAAAWAELARDRAKDRGPFAAPIPRANLAKAGA